MDGSMYAEEGTRDASPKVGPTTATKRLKLIEPLVQGERVSKEIKDAWEWVKEVVLKGGGVGGGRQGASATLEEKVDKLAKAVESLIKAPQKSAPMTYASITANRTQSTVMQVPARRGRELTVKAGEESLGQKRRTNAEIISDTNKAIGVDAVIAARRLPSGDVLLTFTEEAEKKRWEGTSRIAEALGAQARVKRAEYTIIAHGVKVALIKTDQQKDSIEEIYKNNPRWVGKVDILRVGWSRKTIREGRKFAPLHIGVAEPTQANWAIDEGFVSENSYHDCEVFVGDVHITQCFNCYKYGHIAAHCKETQRCGFCAAGGHKTKDCPKENDKAGHRCTNCPGGKKHVAWSRDCRARIEQYQKAKEAYLTRPKSFQVHQKTTASAAQQKDDGFTLVENTQKRRRTAGNLSKGTPVAPRPIGRPPLSRLNEDSATGTPTLAQFHFVPSQTIEIEMGDEEKEAANQSITPTMLNE